MAEQLTPAEFFGTPVSIHDYNGRRWLTAEAAGLCLGYPPDTARQSIVNVYNRQPDEFTEADSCVINLMTQLQARATRIFSATGCIKLGFFAHTPKAKQFRAWAAVTLAQQAPAPAPFEEPLPAVVRSPRLEAQVGRMAGAIETMAGSVATLADGMQTMQRQLNVTAKYIDALERNQRGARRVTLEAIAEAKALRAEGMTNADIARLLRLSHTSVSLIVRDRYPIAERERQPAKPTTGEILERWIEREQQRLTEKLVGATTEGGAA